MSEHAQKTLAEIEAKMDWHRAELDRLGQLRDDLADSFDLLTGPGAGVYRAGRLGVADRVHEIISQLPEPITSASARRALKEHGICRNADLLVTLEDSGWVRKIARGHYQWAGKTAPRKEAAPFNPVVVHPAARPALPSGGPALALSAPRKLPEDPRRALQGISPTSPEAFAQCQTLPATFTLTDLEARVGRDNAGIWASMWVSTGCIKQVSPGTFQRTEKWPINPELNLKAELNLKTS